MTDRTTPVTGPSRIHVQAIPGGATLDISAFVETLLAELATDPEVLDQFSDVVDDLNSGQRRDPHGPERLGLEQLADRLGTRLYVYGTEVSALALRLQEIAAPKAVPAQREGGAAA